MREASDKEPDERPDDLLHETAQDRSESKTFCHIPADGAVDAFRGRAEVTDMERPEGKHKIFIRMADNLCRKPTVAQSNGPLRDAKRQPRLAESHLRRKCGKLQTVHAQPRRRLLE